MKCFNCGAEAPAGNKFCPRCGASMSVGQTGSPAGQAPSGSANPSAGYPNPANPGAGYPTPGNPASGYQNQANPAGGYPNQINPAPGYPMGGYPVPGASIATASMVLGIISDLAMVITGFIAASAQKTVLGHTVYTDESQMAIAGVLAFAAMICAFIGFIMAIVALKKKTPKKGKAIAGLVCNSILVVPILVSLIFGIVLIFI